MSDLKNTITKVAKIMNDQIKADIDVLGVELMDTEWFNKMTDVIIEVEGISFENDSAEFFFKTAFIKEMDSKMYEIIFPATGMDQNGNYTADKSKWA